jgi:hypothetical protein
MATWKPWMNKLLQILVAVILPGGLFLLAGYQAARLVAAPLAQARARAVLAGR